MGNFTEIALNLQINLERSDCECWLWRCSPRGSLKERMCHSAAKSTVMLIPNGSTFQVHLSFQTKAMLFPGMPPPVTEYREGTRELAISSQYQNLWMDNFCSGTHLWVDWDCQTCRTDLRLSSPVLLLSLSVLLPNKPLVLLTSSQCLLLREPTDTDTLT